MSRQRLRESNVKWNIQLTDEAFANKIIKLAEIKSITNKSKISILIHIKWQWDNIEYIKMSHQEACMC